LRHEVREFAKIEIQPRVPEMEKSNAIERDLVLEMARLGWIGVTIPREYGGMEAGHLAKTIIIEEISRVSAAMGAAVQASQLGVAKVLHFGTKEQRASWLTRFATGHALPTIAVTEPESGGHVLGMRSTGVRRGAHYVLNGRKCFVGNSHIGDVHGVVVRTGPGSGGLTAFLVENTHPGFRLGSAGHQTGLRGFSYGELIMEDCRVPVGNRIGEEGQGLQVAYSSSVLYGRPNLTAVALGVHQAVMDDTLAFCHDRQPYGTPLAKLPSVALEVGSLASRLITARLVAYDAVRALDEGASCDIELMNAKLVNTESALTSVRAAIGIFGARACQAEYNLDRYLRDIVHTLPPAGTSDIQRLRLSQAAFGDYPAEWSTLLREHLAPGTRFADEVFEDSDAARPPVAGFGTWRGHEGAAAAT
jgi:alkylation response protein AidB-like acyl-CoA dehydrogenase